jgi:hypothetical protein
MVHLNSCASVASMPVKPPPVAAAFDAFPPAVRKKLDRVRALVFDVAAKTDGVGPLTETLKWGEPAYLTEATRSGSTVRLGRSKHAPDKAAVFFICTTNLVSDFRSLWPDLQYEGDRAILLPLDGELPNALGSCIGMALTYHQK